MTATDGSTRNPSLVSSASTKAFRTINDGYDWSDRFWRVYGISWQLPPPPQGIFLKGGVGRRWHVATQGFLATGRKFSDNPFPATWAFPQAMRRCLADPLHGAPGQVRLLAADSAGMTGHREKTASWGRGKKPSQTSTISSTEAVFAVATQRKTPPDAHDSNL